MNHDHHAGNGRYHQVLAGLRVSAFPHRGDPSLESYDLVSDKYRLMKLAMVGYRFMTVFVPDGNIAAVLDQVRAYQSS